MRCPPPPPRRDASGSVITRHRDLSSSLMTSIVLKSNVTLVDICSTRMLGQYGFLAQVSEGRVVAGGGGTLAVSVGG